MNILDELRKLWVRVTLTNEIDWHINYAPYEPEYISLVIVWTERKPK